MDNSVQLVGTWKLISCFMEDIETKETRQVWGERPNGYLVVTSAGRWIVVQTAEGRKAPHTDEDQSDAFKTLLAYSGKYRTEGRAAKRTIFPPAAKSSMRPRFSINAQQATTCLRLSPHWVKVKNPKAPAITREAPRPHAELLAERLSSRATARVCLFRG
jgi:hypothetical protein